MKKIRLIIIPVLIFLIILAEKNLTKNLKQTNTWRDAYLDKMEEIQDYREHTYYYLQDFDNDDIPELIQNDMEFLHIYKYSDFEVHTIENDVGDFWPYGSSRVVEYSYIPKDGVILGDGGWGPECRWTYLWKYNKKTGMFDEKHCYTYQLYKDLNNNGKYDEGEAATEDGESILDITYFDFDESISKSEYDKAMNYIESEALSIKAIDTFNYSEMIDHLKGYN